MPRSFHLPHPYLVRGRAGTWSPDLLDFRILAFFLNCFASARTLCVMAAGFLIMSGTLGHHVNG